MAEATTLMLLSKLAPLIGDRVRGEVCLLINSTDEANKLKSNLKKIQRYLKHAEQKGLMEVLRDEDQQGPKEASVRSWLDELLDISYEIDDVLDEWESENFKIQNEDPVESPSSSDNHWEKVSSFLQSVCLCFKNVVDRRNLNLHVKQLNERLHQIDQESKKEHKFLEDFPDHSPDSDRGETTSLVNVSEIKGRDREKEILVSKLLSESSSSSSQTKNDIPVISIVGVGGMGKTTLAQLVFNDNRITKHFQEKIWVCVSNPFEKEKVAKAILKSDSPDSSPLETLLQRIVHNVYRKSFLLVLDDVWTEKDDEWKPLREALKYGAPNSRILVTTRKEKVAYVMGSTSMQIQSLNALSNSDCWEVFSQIAFKGRTERECKILNDIGRKIVGKCKGLPLAARTIASHLQYKSREEEWQKVLESEWWKLDEVQKDIFAPLALSYDELEPVAKRCFSYCAIFSKDTDLKPDALIKMWCAQGFLSSVSETSDDMEQKGRDIFDDLAKRSLFQDFKKDSLGNYITCKMHDIVHDFVQFLSKNECLIVENVDGGATSAHVQSARHLNLLDHIDINSILVDKDKVDTNFVLKCRSFLITLDKNIPPNLFPRLKRVRVLFLKNCFLGVIPSEIGSLSHLRFLNLSGNEMKELPEAICDLQNLETLILDRCIYLTAFPQGIHKLRKLRHIFNEKTNNMEFPEGTEKLTNLQTLSEIHVSSRTNWKGLEFLTKMNKLGSSLKISVEGLDEKNGNNLHLLLEAAKKSELKKKKFIQQLQLSYSGKVPIEVLEALQPHPKLRVLIFEGPYLPKWITTLTNLSQLDISITENGVLARHFLRALGAHFLESLTLSVHGMKIPNLEELYTFPKLKELDFSGCWEWEEWEDISEEEENNIINLSIFPSLEKLSFCNCPKLTALPHRLLRRSPCLKLLSVFLCDKLEERYQDWEKVSQIHGISHIKATIEELGEAYRPFWGEEGIIPFEPLHHDIWYELES